MPNCDLHRPVGAILGFGASLGLALHAGSTHPLLEALGGAAGGWIGGALPDWIDPPDSPRHRGFGHGIFTAGIGLTISVVKLRAWQTWLRSRAYQAQEHANAEGWLWALKAPLYHILAGLIAGLISGYICHLADDSQTPSGLPVF